MRRSGTSVFGKKKNVETIGEVTSLKNVGTNSSKLDKEKTKRILIEKAKTNLPTHVVDIFTDDYDILKLDIIVQANIELETERSVERLNNRLGEYDNHKMVESDPEIKILTDRILQLTNNFPIKKYKEKTTDILDEYDNLPKVNIKINKDGRPINAVEKRKKKEYSEIRKVLIRKYINFAKEFMNIDIMEKVSTELSCKVCENPYDITGADPSGQLTCDICGTTTFTTFDFSSSVPKSNNNSDWENFVKTLTNIQGKQKDEVPAAIYDDLDRYFENTQHHRDKVKDMSLDSMGHRGKTSVDLLVTALNMTGHSKYYSDLFLIGKKYWEWELYDLDPYMDIIMAKYELKQSIYYRLDKDRKSSLGTMFLAQQLLNDIFGIGCESGRDIKMHRMRTSIDFHDSCNRIMSDQSILDFFETGGGNNDDIDYVMGIINGISISGDGDIIASANTSDGTEHIEIRASFTDKHHKRWDEVPFSALSTNKRNLEIREKINENAEEITEVRTHNGKIEVIKHSKKISDINKDKAPRCGNIEVVDILSNPIKVGFKSNESEKEHKDLPKIPFKEISQSIRNIKGGEFIADTIDSVPNDILCSISNDVISILNQLTY